LLENGTLLTNRVGGGKQRKGKKGSHKPSFPSSHSQNRKLNMKSRIILLITAAWIGGLSTAFATLQWPMTVENIAELKALHLADVIAGETAFTTSTRPAVYVKGYYSPGDRGGGGV
jgi:hypothetical protein